MKKEQLTQLFIRRTGGSFQAKILCDSGNVYLSIVCGKHLYSMPSENLETPEGYTQFEVWPQAMKENYILSDHEDPECMDIERINALIKSL